MYKKIFSFFAIIFIIGGCGTTNKYYSSMINAKSVPIKNFKTLTPRYLKNDNELLLHLGNTDKEIIMQKGRKVFASKLILNTNIAPFVLDIFSYSAAGFFAPRLYLLDDRGKIVRTIGANNLDFDRGYFKGTIFVNRDYRKIRSIIVTQDLDEIKKSYMIDYITAVPITIPVGMYSMTFVSSSGDQNKTIRNALGGEVGIKLTVYKPRIIGRRN